jgi:sugar-specific transcriptional regulator TrmB
MPDSSTLGEVLVELRALREDVQEIKTDDLAEIKQQVKTTNGRVTALELWKARLDGAKGAYSWVTPFVSAVLSGVIVAVVAAFLHFT